MLLSHGNILFQTLKKKPKLPTPEILTSNTATNQMLLADGGIIILQWHNFQT